MKGMDTSRMAKLLGSRGGRARARRLSEAERRRIASLGGKARARSLEAARRIMINLSFANAVIELRGGAPEVKAMKTFAGPLPGIYRRGL
jgi:hypothetical protein